MKKLVAVLFIFLCIIIAISACGKKILPTGALDATFTYTYTLTPTTTPNMRYDIVVLKNGFPDQGQIVSIKNSAQATWTPVVVNPASGIASFDHITEYGKYDIKISALNTCYDDYYYQVDLHSNSVNVINRTDAPYLEAVSDSGFETFSVYPQNITYTVRLRTDYPYPLNNFTIEGLPAGCAATWDTTTSDMKNDNDFIKLYITTPANHLTNITFTVKADKVNCVSSNRIESVKHTINRVWSINASMKLIYFKETVVDPYCRNTRNRYGIGYKEFSFTPVGFEGPVSWSLSSIDIQPCEGQYLYEAISCNNCNADMACTGVYSVQGYKYWNADVYKSCYGSMSIKIRYYNDKGLNYYQYFHTAEYPNYCWNLMCNTDPYSNGNNRNYNFMTVAGTEQ